MPNNNKCAHGNEETLCLETECMEGDAVAIWQHWKKLRYDGFLMVSNTLIPILVDELLPDTYIPLESHKAIEIIEEYLKLGTLKRTTGG